VLVLLVLSLPFDYSYVAYLRAPGNASVGERTVEWIRDHGGDGVVNRVEQWWYTRTSPGNGQPGPEVLPATPAPVPARVATAGLAGASPAPVAVTPRTPDPLPNEGVWAPGIQSIDGAPVLYTTFLRPDVDHTSVVAGVVRFDQHLVRTVAIPGAREPGGSNWAWGSSIPVAQRVSLVAAFNSGFRFRHIDGGYYTEHRMAVPLVAGDASLVIDTRGRVDIGAWGTDLTMTGDVVSVRQNLHLIVDHGQLVRGLKSNTDGLWGTRRQQLQVTWRSGAGVTANGDLVVVAGNHLTLTALATALADAGAIRAMQLDIHPGQVAVNLFQPIAGTASAVSATKLLPDMPKPATRFLGTDQRDFFAVFAR
jgi:hypothetical protein